LSLHALFELRSSFLNGTLLFDIPAITVTGVINAIVDDMVTTKQLDEENREKVYEKKSFL